MTEVKKFDPKSLFIATFNKALTLQQPLAASEVSRLRRVHPDKSPQELIHFITKVYLAAVTTTGTAAGAAAVVPNPGQIAASAAELVTSTTASVHYVLCIAEIHNLHFEDIEQRRLLVTAAFIGTKTASKVVEKVIPKVAPHWGAKIVNGIPMEAIRKINKIMGPQFVAKYAGKTSVITLSKQVPYMIGALLGGTLNAIAARGIIGSAKTFLGAPPSSWPNGKTSTNQASPVSD
jgi:hypothetical protein